MLDENLEHLRTSAFRYAGQNDIKNSSVIEVVTDLTGEWKGRHDFVKRENALCFSGVRHRVRDDVECCVQHRAGLL